MNSFKIFIKKCWQLISLFCPLRFFTFEKLKLYFFKNVILHRRVSIRKDFFEGFNQIYANTAIHFSHIGTGTYIGSDSQIFKSYIGRFCSLGSKLKIGLGTHPSSNYVSSHPAFYSPSRQAGFTFVEGNSAHFQEYKYADGDYLVTIGNDVWIGYNVIVLDGVKICDGAIIATGSVVTKDVEPYSIVAGVPAKPIGQRFNKEEIDFLLDFCWWNKNIEWIKVNKGFFTDINLFKDVLLRKDFDKNRS